MATRVYLHIGASKTGSTYLQGRCAANAARLREQGLLFPRPVVDHFRMMLGALDQLDASPRPQLAAPALDRLVGLVHAFSDRVLISNELFAAASSDQVRRLVGRLEPAEVHLVYTVRDLSRTLPAEWQQAVKGGYTARLGAYAQAIAETYSDPITEVPPVIGPDRAVEKFRALHRLDDVLARWAAGVSTEHMHIVTLPPSGTSPEVLWERFCHVIEVDPRAADSPARRSNESLGAAEVELLRSLNLRLEENGGYDLAAREWVRHHFTIPYLMKRSGRRPLAIGAAAHAWAQAEAERLVTYLGTGQHDVVGDVADLIPPRTPKAGQSPDDVPPEEVQAVSVDALIDVLGRLRRREA